MLVISLVYFNKEKGIEIAKKTANAGKKGVSITGKFIWDNRYNILETGKGVAKGIGNFGTSVYGMTKNQNDFAQQINRIKEQSFEFERLSELKKSRAKTKDDVLDSLGISISYLWGYAFKVSIPDDVELAYKMAYPGLAGQYSFEELAKDKTAEQLEGLVTGIKGKLFEIRYADYLNDGNLPDGYTATLAESVTNPGWDIVIKDENGIVQQELQLKATESVEYIRHALERYPDIDVVTTDEVYSQINMHGIAENLVNSNISNEELADVVRDSLNADVIEMNWGPPMIPLLIIGYSVWKKSELATPKKFNEAGERYVFSYISYIVGGAVASFTSIWMLGLAASIGTRMIIGSGKSKYIRYRDFQNIIDNNERVLNRMRQSYSV